MTDDPMAARLAAPGPHPAHTAALDLYGRLVGEWAVTNRWTDPHDGTWREGTVVWTFGWILDGLGVQDVMRFRLPDGRTPTGTTVRLYDPAEGIWRVVWFGPDGKTCALTGRADGDDIVQDGTGPDGRPIRWAFRGLTGDAFAWTGHVSDDGGATWRLEQEMSGRRTG
jgi:hypothetical protein